MILSRVINVEIHSEPFLKLSEISLYSNMIYLIDYIFLKDFIYKKPTAIVNGEKLKAFPVRQVISQGHSLVLLLLNVIVEVFLC